MPKPINDQLNVIFSATVAIVYLCLGIYLLIYPIDLGINPYIFGSVIIIYGLFRAWRAFNQFKRSRDENM